MQTKKTVLDETGRKLRRQIWMKDNLFSYLYGISNYAWISDGHLQWNQLDKYPAAKAIWNKIKPATTIKSIPMDDVIYNPEYKNIRNKAGKNLEAVYKINDNLFLTNLTKTIKPITYLMNANGDILLAATADDSRAVNEILRKIPKQNKIAKKKEFIKLLSQQAQPVLDIIKPESDLRITATNANEAQKATIQKIYQNQNRDVYEEYNGPFFVYDRPHLTTVKINDKFLLADLGRVKRGRNQALSSLFSYSTVLMNDQGEVLCEIQGFRAREILIWLAAVANHARIAPVSEYNHRDYKIVKKDEKSNLCWYYGLLNEKQRTY